MEWLNLFGIGFMIINIPGTWFGFWPNEAVAVYLLVNCVLLILYCSILGLIPCLLCGLIVMVIG